MPVVRFTPQDDGGVTITDRAGASVYLPQWRIRGWMRLGSQPAARQAVIDTGAPASILSRSIWSDLHTKGEIDWVCHAPEVTPTATLPMTTILGTRIPYRLGRVRLGIVDLDIRAKELTAKSVLTLCTEDVPTLPHRVIVGLVEAMNGRTLTLSASADGSNWQANLSE